MFVVDDKMRISTDGTRITDQPTADHAVSPSFDRVECTFEITPVMSSVPEGKALVRFGVSLAFQVFLAGLQVDRLPQLSSGNLSNLWIFF